MPAGRTITGLSAAASSTHGESKASVAWWLWWNLLSLDAPTVALLWASLFARFSTVHLTIAEYAALALSVWIVYVSDRLLDVWESKNPSMLPARHRFCFRHAPTLLVALVVAVATIAYTAARELPAREDWCGLVLSGIVVVYMVGIHAKANPFARFMPKELIVGALFAVGTTLPIWSRGSFRSASFSWIAFALLCTLNCLAIEFWERPHSRSRSDSPLIFPVALSKTLISGFAAALAIFAFSAALWIDVTADSGKILFAVCFGALSLLFIHHKRSVLSTSALRVLADAALVFPAVLLWLISR